MQVTVVRDSKWGNFLEAAAHAPLRERGGQIVMW